MVLNRRLLLGVIDNRHSLYDHLNFDLHFSDLHYDEPAASRVSCDDFRCYWTFDEFYCSRVWVIGGIDFWTEGDLLTLILTTYWLFNWQGTLTFASVFLPLYAIFSGIFIQMKDTAVGFHWIFEMSFVKHAMDGASVAILGSNRTKFDCDADYCHYRWPHRFLQSLGMQEDLTKSLQALLIFLFIFRIAAFCIMYIRLKHWKSDK